MDSEDLAGALAGLIGPKQVNFQINVMLLRVGSSYIGTGELGGIVFRGNAKGSASAAARDLIMQLTQGNNQDAGMALDLAAAGETADTLDAQMRAALSTDGRSPRGVLPPEHRRTVEHEPTDDDAGQDDAGAVGYNE